MDNKAIYLLIQIQDRLEHLWPLIDFYNSRTDLRDYAAPILEASMAVENMIVLLAYERGYDYEAGQFIKRITGEKVGDRPLSPVAFADSGYLEDIPCEIKGFLKRIRFHRNIAVHSLNYQEEATSYGGAVVFAEAFDCFVGWFVIHSSTLKDNNNPSVAKFMARIGSLSSRLTVTIKSENEIAEHVFSTTIRPAVRAVQNGEEKAGSEILEKLDKSLELLVKIDAGVIRIEKDVNQIALKLDDLSKRINDYQSLVERQIDMATSEDEIDRIINAYTDECTSRIIREVNSSLAGQAYSSEKEKLIISMGESAWEKLDSSSRNFLITAKITYNNLITMRDVIDYSGVCLLVTKAIEVEMSNRFCRDYLAFLKRRYPGKANYSEYPTALLNQYGKPIRIKDFTLGLVAYVLCYNISDELTPEQVMNDRTKLMEYVSESLMSGKKEKEIIADLDMIAEGVENIRKDYRNPSAHTNQVQSINAKQCFDLVLDVEKFLKTTLDLLDH